MSVQQLINRAIIIGFIAMLTLPFSIEGAIQATYYIDPSKGSDNFPGTLSQPFKTITRARDAVRRINVKITGDIIVYLRGGTYFIASPILFNSRDTGTSGHPITYCNYSGERPIISGGKPITGWTLYDPGENIYQAKNVTFNFRQLYVNGVKAIRARTPNPGNFFRTTGYDLNGKNIQVENSKVANWNNISKVEMHLLTQWADNILRINSFSSNGKNAFVTFQNPDNVIFLRAYPYVAEDQPFYFENAYEFIDMAGEWYLKQPTKTIYYKPRLGEEMDRVSVIAPFVDTLLKIQGDSLEKVIHHVCFKGIVFAHSTYLRPSDSGYLVLQAGQFSLSTTNTFKNLSEEYVGRPSAAVYTANASNIRFERNIFTQLAATGLDFQCGVSDATIIGNTFSDIGGSGISIAKFVQDEKTSDGIPYNPSEKREICSNDSVIDNFITKVTTEIYGACGIACGYVQSITIEHNEVSYCNYSGISVGFGWTGSPNAMNNNKINYNNVHNVMQTLLDGGGIYVLSNQYPNSQINYNYIHDIGPESGSKVAVWAIYPDEGTYGYTISYNVIINASVIKNSGSPNLFLNNSGTDTNAFSNFGIEQNYKSKDTLDPLILSLPGQQTNINKNNENEIFVSRKGYVQPMPIGEEMVNFSILDLKGRVVLKNKIKGFSMVNLTKTGLGRGLYVIQRKYNESGNKIFLQKFNFK